jgi:hypothetical protein
MLMSLLLQVLGPEACILSGLCAAPDPGPRIPSGIMFTALGLVAAGLVGMRVERARRRPTAAQDD